VDEPREGTVRQGEVLTLVQRSARRRDHELRRGDQARGQLRFTAAQGFLRSSVRITAQEDLPGQAAVLLCLIGGFLALRELQAEVDASAAVGGIVAGAG
jgi:hypothetical protein